MIDQAVLEGLAERANDIAQRVGRNRREYDCGEATDLSRQVEELALLVSDALLAISRPPL